MAIGMQPDVVAMSQRERDALKILHTVREGKRTQVEAARLLKRSTRQVRRLLEKLQRHGDAALVHRLRGRPSNRRLAPAFRRQVLQAYRRSYRDFGPTLAAEKLSHEGLAVGVETLRRWLLAEGLWQRRRQRDPHRTRRPRRSCFGELVQMDASIHDWLEGRGESMVLIALIDDATSRVEARFYAAATVATHMDLLSVWLRQYGRPQALYTDRHSIFELQDKGRAVPDGTTQFGRALAELDVDLIRAHSPQAKGRIERLFGTAQDRWVKELRLKRVRTLEHANRVLDRLVKEFNRRFTRSAAEPGDAHRRLGPEHRLESILSIQSQRVVSNDYTVRFDNRFYQLLKPVHPGERGGRVVIEERLDGTLRIRFRGQYLNYRVVPAGAGPGGSAPKPPEFSALAADAREKEEEPGPTKGPGSPGMQPTGGRSGRTPAEPYPPDGAGSDTSRGSYRPGPNHPWRKPLKPLK